jgi:hypothetical protein
LNSLFFCGRDGQRFWTEFHVFCQSFSDLTSLRFLPSPAAAAYFHSRHIRSFLVGSVFPTFLEGALAHVGFNKKEKRKGKRS